VSVKLPTGRRAGDGRALIFHRALVKWSTGVEKVQELKGEKRKCR